MKTWKVLFWTSLGVIATGVVWSMVIYFQYWEIVRTPKQMFIQSWIPTVIMIAGLVGMNICNYKRLK